MKSKNRFILSKEKFSFVLILSGMLLCIPFTVLDGLFNEIIKQIIIILLSIFLIISSEVFKNSKILRTIILTILIMSLYASYYLINNLGYLNSLVLQLINTFFILSIYLYLKSGIHSEAAFPLFVKIIIIVSILTIISFVGANTGIIPFHETNLAGYKIGFNPILGGVSQRGIYRPHYYFAEPSYLGFFLGFSLIFIKQIKNIEYKKIKLILVFVSGIMVFSTTFYTAVVIWIVAELITKILKSKIKSVAISKIYLSIFIIFSLIIFNKREKIYSTFFSDYATSFTDRQDRIEKSISTIENSSFNEILLGKGTGYIWTDKSRDRGESNIYVKTLLENGIIILFIYVFIIYHFLKHQSQMLIFTLVALHSVVILDTPFFIFILLMASIIEKVNKNQLIKFSNS